MEKKDDEKTRENQEIQEQQEDIIKKTIELERSSMDNFQKHQKEVHRVSNIKRRSQLLDKSMIFTENIINGKLQLIDLLKDVEELNIGMEKRKILWMIFLDILHIQKVSKWRQILTDKRKKYDNDFHNNHSHKSEYKDILHIVTIDVQRTYQEIDLFRNLSVKEILIRVLFTWALQNQDLNYVQGMNELAGTLFYVIYSNRVILMEEDQEKSFHYFLNNEDYMEEDLFIMFDNIMQRAFKNLYMYSEKKVENMMFGKVDGFEYIQMSNLSSLEKILKENVSHLRKRINKIFSFYLKIYDKELHDLIVYNNIEPYLFIFRWLLCMLTREFSMDRLLKLWDIIFAYEKSEEVVLNFFCMENKIKVGENKLSDIIPTVLKGYKMNEFNYLDFLIVALILELKHKFGTNLDEMEILHFIMHLPEDEIDLKQLVKTADLVRDIVYQQLLIENEFVVI